MTVPPALLPQVASQRHRIDALLAPPDPLVAGAVQLAVMGGAQGDGELV
jgi:hypothetical protein